MAKPRLLDLFCGGGGCAMGYSLAGFDVVGVDHVEQPNYLCSGASAFVRADALDFVAKHGGEFDAIHASPPCQHFSRATAWRGRREDHPDLIAQAIALLDATGRPHVVENVPESAAKMGGAVLLCGTMFGLRVWRHRLFRLSPYPLLLVPECQHRADDYSFDHGGKQTESVYREAMGCGWMTVAESRQAIPPAYTEFLGRQLIRIVKGD